MDKFFLQQLERFLQKAALATYAGNGPDALTQRPGFRELEYKEGEWEYRDSYCGFFESWGQEVVWCQGKVVWTCLYGGGMESEYHENKEFATQTFDFLKKALSTKQDSFQPRGPKKYIDGEWKYTSVLNGDITWFKGNEEIVYQDKRVFTHEFIGGFAMWK